MKWFRNNIEIKESIVDYLENLFDDILNKNHKFKVSIGTDSQKISPFKYKFATVILITTYEELGGINVGRGGMMVYATYNHEFKSSDKEIINERMVFEVSKSIEVAYHLSTLLDLYEVKLEIHADINPNPMFESNKALQQSVGYILGMGYNFKIKPDAIASSSCADKII
jgi:predicted RNase H-related nuclease YkuK (DUF458 family)